MPMHPNARRKVMNAAFRGDALTFPTTYFARLHTTALSTSTLPSSGNMVSTVGTGLLTSLNKFTTGLFSSATTVLSTVHLTTGVQFPDPLTNWSTVYGISFWDSSVTTGAASSCWFFGNVDTPVAVSAGNPIRISSGATTNGLRIGLA